MSAGSQDEPKSGEAKSNFARRFLTVLLTVIAIVLFALVLTRTFVSYLDGVDPVSALAIRASDANAELQLARNWLARTVEPEVDARESAEQIRQRLIRATAAEPLNAPGFELLGILAARANDMASAATFMQAASARSLRTSAALYWLMHQKFSEGDVKAAISYGDALLRIRPGSISDVVPTFAQIAEMPGGANRMVATLSKPPPWREKFFHTLNGRTSNPDTPLNLLLGLKRSEHPPTPHEIDAYLRYLMDRRNYELAYSSWLQLLPPEQIRSAGLLFNGNFELPASGLPFDWTIQGSSGVVAEIAAGQGPKETNALSVELAGGRVDFRPISQALLLAPGRYRLVGTAKGHLKGLRGLKWQIACLDDRSRSIGETSPFLDGSSDWTEFSAVFEIPAGCRAQILRLILDARSASETLVSGSFAFADLRLLREEQ